MESFPEDLLVGVFPLVFAINATQPSGGEEEGASSSRLRSRFDKFLDVMVASLLADNDNASVDSGATGEQQAPLTGDKKRSVSLFRPDEDEEDYYEYSSDEEDLFLDMDLSSHASTAHRNHNKRRSSGSAGGGSFSSSIYPPFGRRNNAQQQQQQQRSGSIGGASASSFAKALAQGQSFFERARIESYGTTHGFPPSKDPKGVQHNVAHQLAAALLSSPPSNHKSSSDSRKQFAQQQERLLERWRNDYRQSLSGILPAGWLEKHVHALPSSILVVCNVTSTAAEQEPHDRHLFQTMEHLAYSLAPKRRCKIHVVGLLDDDVTVHQGDVWAQAILTRVEESTDQQYSNSNSGANNDPAILVTLLRASQDLEFLDAGLPPGPALKQLHASVRDASLTYYLQEARRTKEKLSKLLQPCRGGSGSGRGNNNSTTTTPPEALLPLVIRYCVKIAFFYEFQLKHDKALRFLAEGYRYVCRYHHYLQTLPADGSGTAAPPPAPQQSPPHHQHYTNATHDSVEVEFAAPTSTNKALTLLTAALPSVPPADMIHQCRTVAEWINLKLLLAGFRSHTESGFWAATGQWREHQRQFGTPYHNSRRRKNPAPPPLIPEWLEWSFVARQRLVLSQLVERHSVASCVDWVVEDSSNNHDNDELLALCSPWRTSLAAAEALLRLARELDVVQRSSSPDEQQLPPPSSDDDTMRDPFIGAARPSWQDEVAGSPSPREKALELVLKSIGLYEGELRRDKRGFYAEDAFMESSSSRAGARMCFLAGGLLLGLQRHDEAVPHLEKATKYAKGWQHLEMSIRKLLIECYDKHVPSHNDPMANESSQALASMILDSYFNAEMSSHDLRRALAQFSTLSGNAQSLKWYRECWHDEDVDLPFSFEVTFSHNIFATIGDTVQASIWIRSNLDYAVHVQSVTLLSLAGELPVAAHDLMRAHNASEGGGGDAAAGIIIQRHYEITIETALVLPKDLSIIAADDSGNGGELQGIAGKGSFAKSARPRSAGLTSAGGARLLSADQLSRENKVTQGWSLRFLGGKPLKCDGIRLAFYPVKVGRGGSSAADAAVTVPVIDLTIDKKKPRTAADIKRTPFEEENYICSAWSRPSSLPLARGPRSLRVLGPQPQMVIANLTETATGGKALEGTVNRVLLQLQAGPHERCAELAFKVTVFSVLITADGTTKRLVAEHDLTSEAETSVDMKNAKYRTPVLVVQEQQPAGGATRQRSEDTDYGFAVPPGWSLAGQGMEGKLESLQGGQATYIALNFFRPSPVLQTGEAEVINTSLCKTDFYVTVSYRKERATAAASSSTAAAKSSSGSGGRGGGRGRAAGRGGRGRGRGRRAASTTAAPEEESMSKQASTTEFSASDVKAAPDDVTLEYSGAVVWSRPMEATFEPGVDLGQPSGIPHPSNTTATMPQQQQQDSDPEDRVDTDEFVAVEGGRLATKCLLHTTNTSDELRTELVGIRFQNNNTDDDDDDDDDPQQQLQIDLLDQSGAKTTTKSQQQLYRASTSDPACRVLAAGSKFSVAYTVQVGIRGSSRSEHQQNAAASKVRGPLGTVEVDWMPFPLLVPESSSLSPLPFEHHGPLRLARPSTIRFQGPTCLVQKAPFEARLVVQPPTPTVAQPFEVQYVLRNLTALHQTLALKMAAPPAENDLLLLAGFLTGRLALGPKEEQTVTYTVLAMRPGPLWLPPLSISSNRYRTWVVHETAASSAVGTQQAPLYIFP